MVEELKKEIDAIAEEYFAKKAAEEKEDGTVVQP